MYTSWGRVGTFGKHELALNPDGFIGQTDEQVCQTLAHEMAPEAALGNAVGGRLAEQGMGRENEGDRLAAVSTGMVGGKETGQRMADYIIPGGAFTRAFARLAAAGWKLNLQSAHYQGKATPPNSKKIHLSELRAKRLGQTRSGDRLPPVRDSHGRCSGHSIVR